ncbi:MAG: SRPBCC domain-containing protein [Myxococcaceae bacterium]|nr:SRPBCC domain-containing protein [Myxococcaceae bacterium]
MKPETVVVTTVVEVPPARAFELFTKDIDVWWKRSPRFRRWPGQQGRLAFEGTPPERLVERDGTETAVVGRVLAWAPGERLALAWAGAGFTEKDGTEVHVQFEKHAAGTRVTLEHRNIGALPASHPLRRGFTGEAFEAMYGYFWAELLTGLRASH